MLDVCKLYEEQKNIVQKVLTSFDPQGCWSLAESGMDRYFISEQGEYAVAFQIHLFNELTSANYILIYYYEKGAVLREPSFISYIDTTKEEEDKYRNRIKALVDTINKETSLKRFYAKKVLRK